MKVSLTRSMCMLQNIGFQCTKPGLVHWLCCWPCKIKSMHKVSLLRFLAVKSNLSYIRTWTWHILKINAPGDRKFQGHWKSMHQIRFGASILVCYQPQVHRFLVFKILRCIDFGVPQVPGASIFCFKITRCIDFSLSKPSGASILVVLFKVISE